jgi:hypothetical protein
VYQEYNMGTSGGVRGGTVVGVMESRRRFPGLVVLPFSFVSWFQYL